MLHLEPGDPEQLKFALHRAVKQSGLSLEEISKQLEDQFGEKLSLSAISHSIWRGSVRFQRALQILAVCDVKEVEIVMRKR